MLFSFLRNLLSSFSCFFFQSTPSRCKVKALPKLQISLYEGDTVRSISKIVNRK